MRVVVVELRASGMKLTRTELEAARRHVGELTIEGSSAYLHGDAASAKNLHFAHLIPVLYEAHLRRMRGDDFVVVGKNAPVLTPFVNVWHAQAWWCRPARPDV